MEAPLSAGAAHWSVTASAVADACMGDSGAAGTLACVENALHRLHGLGPSWLNAWVGEHIPTCQVLNLSTTWPKTCTPAMEVSSALISLASARGAMFADRPSTTACAGPGADSQAAHTMMRNV